MSKKQASVETSSHGSKIHAMKICVEYVCVLLFKLRMIGNGCEESNFIYGDNKSVLCNSSLPDLTVKRIWRTAHVHMHLNLADLLTKPLPCPLKRTGFVKMILHHIFGSSDAVE